MNEQKIKEILGSMKKIHLTFLTPIPGKDSQQIMETKLECLTLLRDSVDLLLKCAKESMEKADKDWNNWLKKHEGKE